MKYFCKLALIFMLFCLSSCLTIQKHNKSYKIIDSTLPDEVINTIGNFQIEGNNISFKGCNYNSLNYKQVGD